MTPNDVEHMFTYHAPTDGEKKFYEMLNTAFLRMAYRIISSTPVSREQSTAIQYLRTARMWANAAIACNPPQEATPAPGQEGTPALPAIVPGEAIIDPALSYRDLSRQEA